MELAKHDSSTIDSNAGETLQKKWNGLPDALQDLKMILRAFRMYSTGS